MCVLLMNLRRTTKNIHLASTKETGIACFNVCCSFIERAKIEKRPKIKDSKFNKLKFYLPARKKVNPSRL